MPRKHRRDAAGAISHVDARGVNGCAIFRSRLDRLDFLALLAEVVDRFEWRVYSYCLMTNHYHLVVRTLWPNLAAGIQRLNGIHAQRYNGRHGRTGHLFGGRYNSKPVVDEHHLFTAVRYDVLNPVRAGLCRRARDWEWSSYRASAGGAPCAFLALDELLPLFGRDVESARRRYRELVAADEAWSSGAAVAA
jgi:putative transposase